MSSLSLLMKETLFFTDRSSLLCMDSSREKSKSNLQNGRERREKSLNSLALPSPSRVAHLFALPLVEFWVEIPLLGGGSPLGGGLLVRQQDEGNIRVRTVLGAGRQGSVAITFNNNIRWYRGLRVKNVKNVMTK